MARTELTNRLYQEALSYLGLPYHLNRPPSLRKSNVYQGKGTRQQIAKETKKIALKERLEFDQLSPRQIYRLQKKNQLGIDCSALAFHLANFYHLLRFGRPITPYLIGTGGKKGVRRLSASILTSPQNSLPVSSYPFQPADLIRLDRGHHVAFILDSNPDQITYIHSSRKTLIRGVHLATIAISNPSLPLNEQLWSEKTITNKPYSSLFYPQKGDGVFRLKVFT